MQRLVTVTTVVSLPEYTTNLPLKIDVRCRKDAFDTSYITLGVITRIIKVHFEPPSKDTDG